MCGFFAFAGRPGALTEAKARAAAEALRHRGPDSVGLQRFAQPGWEVWLGHTRLSIMDLREVANQPFAYEGPSGRGVMVFNGEVYNHRTLREAVTPQPFRTSGDTESLLVALLELEGEALARANGMLALVVLDLERERLLVARDRLGKKPLYVHHGADGVAFASEPKSFFAAGLPMTPDPEVLAELTVHGYVPGLRTVYRECRRFPAGAWQSIPLGEGPHSGASPRLFWDPFARVAERTRPYAQALEEASELLDDATKIRLEADVPLGAFLSGGVDSSLVASSLARVAKDRVTAYTVASPDPEGDESPVARETAAALGLRCETLRLSAADLVRQLERMPALLDDPIADVSLIPTLAISEAARREVKVVLTGDGGDEVFLGYPVLLRVPRLFELAAPLRAVRPLAWASSAVLRSRAGEGLARATSALLGMSQQNAAQKLASALDVIESSDVMQAYDTMMAVTAPRLASPKFATESVYQRMRTDYPGYSWDALDARDTPTRLAGLLMVSYMRDCILVKADRATMAHGLEGRAPLLDYRIVELGLSLPLEYKTQGARGKRLMRDLLARRVGPRVASLPKRGFVIPLPADMPPGATDRQRWSAWVLSTWRRNWGT